MQLRAVKFGSCDVRGERMRIEYPMLVFFSSPPLSPRSLLLRAFSFSTITHCAPCSAGFVLERTFRNCRIVRAETFVRLYPRNILAVQCGSEPVLFPDIHGSYPAIPALYKRLLGSHAPYADDCLGVVCSLLMQAGVSVPARISTPASLLRWLSKRYQVKDLG